MQTMNKIFRVKSLFFTTFIFLATFTMNSYAALAPFYQSARELQFLLEWPPLVKQLAPNEEITSIERKGDLIQVKTKNCHLKMKIFYINDSTMPGPVKFDWQLLSSRCN